MPHLAGKVPGGVELLDAAVAHICSQDIAGGVGDDAGTIKFSIASHYCPTWLEGAGGVELLDAAVIHISHIDIAGGVGGDARVN